MIVDETDDEEAAGEKPEDTCFPFSHVEAMGSEWAEERLECPGYGVIGFAGGVAVFCVALHARDQEDIDEPADTEQTSSKEPKGAGFGFTEVKAVGSSESEDPEDVAYRFGVGVVRSIHAPIFRDEGGIDNGNAKLTL